MKLSLRHFLISAWIFVFTILLTRFWYREPDIFPGFLKLFGNWLIDMLGPMNAEQSADIELLYGAIVSFAMVSFLTWGALYSLRLFYGRKR
jgi:hypothetical protein